MFISQEDEIKLRDSESKEYADWVKNTRGYWFYAQQSAVKNLMKFKKSDVVLDAGCGVGLHTIPYSRYVEHITAVDFSQGMINALTRKLLEVNISNVTVCSGDLTDLRLGDEIFDKSYSVGVIQHIPTYEQRVKALTNIHRSLKENGIFLMECYKWGGWLKPPKLKEAFMDNGLYRFAFTKEDAVQIFQDSGFKNIVVRGTMNIPRKIKKRLPHHLSFIDAWMSNFDFSASIGMDLIAIGTK